MKKFIAVMLLLAMVVISAPAVVDACTYRADDPEKKCLYGGKASTASVASVSSVSSVNSHKFTSHWNNLVAVIMGALCKTPAAPATVFGGLFNHISVMGGNVNSGTNHADFKASGHCATFGF